MHFSTFLNIYREKLCFLGDFRVSGAQNRAYITFSGTKKGLPDLWGQAVPNSEMRFRYSNISEKLYNEADSSLAKAVKPQHTRVCEDFTDERNAEELR